MKICVAQSRPAKGDIDANIEQHKKFVQLAAGHKADLIVFPELSLTGYEPTIAKDLAVDLEDHRFDGLQKMSDANNIFICAGMPLKNNGGVSIAMIIFQPAGKRQVYFKKYLHPDEDDFFVPGENLTTFEIQKTKASFAICYEISVDEHREKAVRAGNRIYIASVAKFVKGTDKALNTLSETARKHSMTVMMSNCVGSCDGRECGGRSSGWSNDGTLTVQLDDQHEGILLVDTETRESIGQRLLP